jgi:hypothetical protein
MKTLRLLFSCALLAFALALLFAPIHAQDSHAVPTAATSAAPVVPGLVTDLATPWVESAAHNHPGFALLIALVGILNLVLTPLSEAIHQFLLTQPTAAQVEADKLTESKAWKVTRFLITWLSGFSTKPIIALALLCSLALLPGCASAVTDLKNVETAGVSILTNAVAIATPVINGTAGATKAIIADTANATAGSLNASINAGAATASSVLTTASNVVKLVGDATTGFSAATTTPTPTAYYFRQPLIVAANERGN